MEVDTNALKNTKKSNPVQNANPISALTFSYMFPIFKKVLTEKLSEDDLFEPLNEHKSSIVGDDLERVWEEENKKHKKTALHRALFRLYGFPFIVFGLLKLVDELILVIVLPLAVGKLVSYFEKDQTKVSDHQAYIYAVVLIIGLLADSLILHPNMMGIRHISMKLRISCSSLVYRKTLRLSRTALEKTTIGQLVNILSNDVSKFDQSFLLAHFAWLGPIQTSVGIYLLYRQIGISALFGMAFLMSFIPLQAWLGQRTSVLRLRTAVRTDERVRLMNEILSGIQVIKMYCWEKPFAQLISFARRKEMKAIRAKAYLVGLIYSFEVFVTRTSIFISLLGYVLLGNYITAEKVFTITAIYNALRPVVTVLFSQAITGLAETNVSILRLQELLNYEEQTDHKIENKIDRKSITNGVQKPELNDTLGVYNIGQVKYKVALENVTAKWSGDSPDDTLKNISLALTNNQLLAVIGPVGSGKSSLLNVLLKELPITSGKMLIVGSISFSAQEPWLFSGSIKQNILFGSEYDEDRYDKVVNVCALRSDFALFPFGDRTLVGEKGKALSGGQKARINLARCIYKRADIYLLDDPLSAVDTNVGKHLYERCVKEFLHDKICILVTHQLQYLKNANKIIIMKEGQIELEGNYKELQSSGLDFAKLLEEFNAEDNEEKDKKIRSRQNSVLESEDVDEKSPEIEKESQSTGSIDTHIYWEYLKSGGGKITISFLCFLFVICQTATNGSDYFLSWWVNLEQDFTEKVNNNQTKETETLPRENIIYIYTAITLGTIVVALIKSLYFMLFFTIASVNLHDFIFSKIIQAKMKFFNKNPSGRILNRFSKDLGNIDEYIPSVMIEVIETALILVGVLVLTTIVNPWLLIPSSVLVIIFYFFRMVFIETSRCVKRIEAITRSPILSHMTASVQGLSTIRAFGAQQILIKEFDDFQDNHSSAFFLYIAASRCFGFWLDIICIVFVGLALIFLLSINKGIYGGQVGLVLTQYMGLIGYLQYGVRQFCELENQMISVERILEYTKLESEPERKEPNNLPKNWPEQGALEFRDVSLRYNETEPYVLKNLNFSVKPNEKVGIVGRTGAGKSSTISALFQLYDLDGKIIVDNIDTTQLPLDEVRSKISIIPQEPVLFSGTMRKNLDPFEEYNDDTLWNALDQVELKDIINDLPSGLNSNVSEGGTNFSVGQRQLVCLARALIRNNKILVLDEATANVDPHTDLLIQNTIKNKFANCSVLTIAHRLNTVMDSDRILVMNAGSMEEFDHPYVLLQKEDGILYNLVKTTGKNNFKILQNIAKENYLKIKSE